MPVVSFVGGPWDGERDMPDERRYWSVAMPVPITFMDPLDSLADAFDVGRYEIALDHGWPLRNDQGRVWYEWRGVTR